MPSLPVSFVGLILRLTILWHYSKSSLSLYKTYNNSFYHISAPSSTKRLQGLESRAKATSGELLDLPWERGIHHWILYGDGDVLLNPRPGSDPAGYWIRTWHEPSVCADLLALQATHWIGPTATSRESISSRLGHRRASKSSSQGY
jgi:hypothetical protein